MNRLFTGCVVVSLGSALASLGMVGSACVAVVPAPRYAHAAVVVPFDEALSPYGSWVVVARFGRVWRPHAHLVGAAFVPYASHGHWVLTEQGWVFESDFAWGWAAYHYGRWYLDPLEGWVWVPDDVWGPSWVEWRSGGGFVGWVPLPPSGIELVFPAYRPRWCFVEAHRFTHHDVWQYQLDDARAEHAYHAATPVPRGRGPEASYVAPEPGRAPVPVNIGPPPPPGVVQRVAVPRELPQRAPEVTAPAPPPPPPPRRFERPPDRRPEAQPVPAPAVPPPPPARLERPADRRPPPEQPFRFEPPPAKPAPAPVVPPAAPQNPQQEQNKKKKRPLSS